MGAGMDNGGLLGVCEGAKRLLKSACRSSAWGSVHTAFCAAADKARTFAGQVHLCWCCPAGSASHDKAQELEAAVQQACQSRGVQVLLGLQHDKAQTPTSSLGGRAARDKDWDEQLQPLEEVSHSAVHLPARQRGWVCVAGWNCCCCQCPATL